LELQDWVTPDALILSPVGELDGQGCAFLKRRFKALFATWPGLYVTLDLSSTAVLDAEAVEDLLIELVAHKARGAQVMIARPSLSSRAVLRRLNLDFWPQLPTHRPLEGVTA
jgi:anti-anti-sigma regulatory factor